MASTQKHHHELTDGVGKCSVPMWQFGSPAGFCDASAYGKRPPCQEWRDAYTGGMKRMDGRYNGYVPGLACPAHGGPEPLKSCPFGCSGLAWDERSHVCTACGFAESPDA